MKTFDELFSLIMKTLVGIACPQGTDIGVDFSPASFPSPIVWGECGWEPIAPALNDQTLCLCRQSGSIRIAFFKEGYETVILLRTRSQMADVILRLGHIFLQIRINSNLKMEYSSLPGGWG